MHPYTYTISLRVRHPTLDPQIITDTLGMQPRITNRVGEPRTTLTGAVLDGIYTRTYWCADFTPPDDSEVGEFLGRIVTQLGRYRLFFKQIRDAGGSVEFFIGLFADGVNIGTTLSHDVLASVGDMGIDLTFDIYDYKENVPAG
ncbi:MAG TPA: DUF4279 domain-containing protein [Candidatus Sulfotelmatobacter sp.]|jgi:hypothetical protein|nr:DUF4279 domain-containing protein [Candidatus Sulfotelmatobacter sp.]